jgi:hypothetical protein
MPVTAELDGQEYEFPDGTSPEEIADTLATVKPKYQGTQSLVNEMGARTPGGYEMSDYADGPLAAGSSLMGTLRKAARPESVGDMLQFALPSGVGVGAMEAARSSIPGAVADMGRSVKGVLRGVPVLGKMFNNYNEARSLRGALRVNPFPPLAEMNAAKPMEAAAAAPVSAGSGILSAADKAALAKQGYSPEVIARIEGHGRPVMPTGTPSAAPPKPSMALVQMSLPDVSVMDALRAKVEAQIVPPIADEAPSMFRNAIDAERARKKGWEEAHRNIDFTGRGGR